VTKPIIDDDGRDWTHDYDYPLIYACHGSRHTPPRIVRLLLSHAVTHHAMDLSSVLPSDFIHCQLRCKLITYALTYTVSVQCLSPLSIILLPLLSVFIISMYVEENQG
jgi:hypothetical protein